MKLLVKILLGAVGLVLALAIALAVAVTLLFDPKNYQPMLAGSVEQATGRKLTFSGDLGLDLFPCCSITLGRTALGNPPGFPAGDFASVGSASLSLKLWPLISSREVQIGTVRLSGLDANLLVRNDGASNWTFEGREPAGDGTPADGADAGAGPERLFIEGVEIENGRISYRDEQDPAAYLAEDLQLSTGHLEPGEPFDLKLATKLTDQTDGTAGNVALESTATVDKGFTRITLANPSFDISAGGGVVPAKSLVMKLGAAELGIENEQATRLRFKGLEGEFTLEALEALAGDAEGSFVADDARLELGAANSLNVPALAADITVSGEKTPGGSVNSVVRLGGLSVDLDKMWAGIESLSADVTGLGGRLALTGSGRVADTGAALSGTMKLEPLSPRSVLAVLKQPEPQTADPKALTRLSGESAWALGKDSLQLDGMNLQLDDSRVTGTLAVTGFDKPATRFDLKLDTIDLDRYLEPDATPPAVGAAPAAINSPASPAEDIPVDLLRDLRLDGRLQVGQFKLADVRLSNLDAKLKADGGKLRVEPLKGKLYGGDLAGAMSVDASGGTARISVDQQLAAVQVGQALKELFQNDKLTGALTGRINARGTGNTSDELLRTLAGNVALSLADGAYLGSDLWYEIRAARARLRGDPVPAPPASPRTPFNALEIAGTITDGVLNSDRLFAEIPFIRMKGTGTLNLVSKAMDYKLQAEVFQAPVFEDDTDLKDLAGLTIAMNLKGPMDSPKVSVDLKNLAAGVATQKLKNRLIKKLGLDKPEEGAVPAEEAQPTTEPPPEEKPRDALKRTLRDLLKPPP